MEFSPLHLEGPKDPRQIVDRLQSEIRESNGVKAYLDTLFERFMESRSFALLKVVGDIIHPSDESIVGPEFVSGNFNAFLRGGLIGLSVSEDIILRQHDDLMASSMEHLMILYGVSELRIKEINAQRQIEELSGGKISIKVLSSHMDNHTARAMEYLGDAVYEDSLAFHRAIDTIAAEVCTTSEEESHFYNGFGFVLGVAEQAGLRLTRDQ